MNDTKPPRRDDRRKAREQKRGRLSADPQKYCFAKLATASAMTMPIIHCSLSNFASSSATSVFTAITSAFVASDVSSASAKASRWASTIAAACSRDKPAFSSRSTNLKVSNVMVAMGASLQHTLKKATIVKLRRATPLLPA